LVSLIGESRQTEGTDGASDGFGQEVIEKALNMVWVRPYKRSDCQQYGVFADTYISLLMYR